MDYSNDVVNQITLNCLISKSQLIKINNTKIKKNLNVERSKKIKKYNSQLLELFEKLLNKTEPSDLFDDVKSSYVNFIDKTIIYLDNINANMIKEEIKIQEEENMLKDISDNSLNNKINNMMNRCYDDRYYEMIIKEEHKDLESQMDPEQSYEDDEDDEDDEY